MDFQGGQCKKKMEHSRELGYGKTSKLGYKFCSGKAQYAIKKTMSIISYSTKGKLLTVLYFKTHTKNIIFKTV